jgi:signal transduction histidine kinase
VQQSEAEIKNVTLTLRAPPVPLLVTIDASRITQALTNLVVNAINYTPSGGDVLIETAALDEGWAVVRVRDTGVGISSQYLAHVFEPFFRLQGEAVRGTGLGLSITREVVQLHGGEITVTSEPGQGSCFSVKLRLTGAG